MTYFKLFTNTTNRFIRQRKNRALHLDFYNFNTPNIGDIINISYRNEGNVYYFEGICIAINKKSMQNPDSQITLRNVINKIGVELKLAFFLNRLFQSKLSDFRRKKFNYKSSKLYFLRSLSNMASYIKA